MSRIVYVNGEYLPEEEAKVSIFDRGFLFADGVYEVTSVLDGRLVDRLRGRVVGVAARGQAENGDRGSGGKQELLHRYSPFQMLVRRRPADVSGWKRPRPGIGFVTKDDAVLQRRNRG